MADYAPLTPQQIARRMRLPEDDPNYVNDPNRAMLAPLMIYGGAFGPEVAGALGAGSEVAPAAEAAPSMLARAAQYARGLETAGSKLSPSELAVIQAKYPGRFINPQTGFPQSVGGDVLTGQAAPAMGAVSDPFAGLIQGAEEAPAAVRDYLTKPRPVTNPDTGYQLQQIMPGGKFGPGMTDWTTGQQAARTAVAAAPLVPAAALAPSQIPGMAPSYAAIPSDYSGDTQSAPAALSAGAGRGFMLPSADDRASAQASNAAIDAVNAARARTAPAPAAAQAPMPMRRPSDADLTAANPQTGPSSSIFSKIFDPNYQKGWSQRQLWDTANADPDNPAAFFRAAKGDTGTPPSENRGGSVGGKGKSEKMPDPVHKALEIIHHLLTR
jgi:hypothetical protein